MYTSSKRQNFALEFSHPFLLSMTIFFFCKLFLEKKNNEKLTVFVIAQRIICGEAHDEHAN